MVSILIPVYNEYDRLDIVLRGLLNQTYEELFEVVVVDDGSNFIDQNIINKYSEISKFDLKFIINSENLGRSASRNRAIMASREEILIFCDADRMPTENFIKDHVDALSNNSKIICVGKVLDTYYSVEEIIKKNYTVLTRESIYYKKIANLFSDDGISTSKLSWLATLSGNMSIKRSSIKDELFDENFKEWGFEHFELGYRLTQKGINLFLHSNATNIHISHYRDSSYYDEHINKSHKIFYNKYLSLDIKYLKDFILGSISLQEYEKLINGDLSWTSKLNKDIYNKIVNK